MVGRRIEGAWRTGTLTTLRLLPGKSSCFLALHLAELFDESFSFGDFVRMLCCAFVGKVMKQIQRFAWSRGTVHPQIFAALKTFSRS